ncbi:HD domain-containing protein [Yoonia sp. TsM2_T14_4]|uniref:HD domain-containing protein n=1 Tax=Yoonia sp. TsM2_T14_4 TaxID=3415141 RepID=UPI003C74C1D1
MANTPLDKRSAATADRIAAQLAFLTEACKLKSVLRATTLCDGSRRENSGEHSWHIALYALVLGDQAQADVNIDRVIRMLLIHDLVEIDAGDMPVHGTHDAAAQAQIEQIAARRIFGLLPPDQAQDFRALWDEFEAAETPDAIFAKSIDRVQPVIANLETGGGTWPAYGVTAAQLETRVGAKVARGAPALWSALKHRIDAWFAARASSLE